MEACLLHEFTCLGLGEQSLPWGSGLASLTLPLLPQDVHEEPRLCPAGLG